ncbi:MAG: archaellin/type IV pilin N-terminal domain-containing protein [Chloroflexota bacterium]|nr:archaellin/type IV pilin N-terminal domain-containing protein [Chloroflexota bacterium]
MNESLKDESGITALETAIILTAFIVVAAVFAFTILQAGTFPTELGREASYSDIEQLLPSIKVIGTIKAERNPADTAQVMTIKFELQSSADGGGINMADTLTTSGSDHNEVVISYGDNETYVPKLDWETNWIVGGTDDDLLEEGEIAEITIQLVGGKAGNGSPGNDVTTLGAGEEFMLEIKPPQGDVIPIVRTTPASLDAVMFLND